MAGAVTGPARRGLLSLARACQSAASRDQLCARPAVRAAEFCSSPRDSDRKEGQQTPGGQGQWRKWIEGKLAEKDRKPGAGADGVPSTRVSAAKPTNVLKEAKQVGGLLDSVDDFERRVLGTQWKADKDGGDSELLKELDAIDNVSGVSGGIYDEEEDVSIQASWANPEPGTQADISVAADRGLAAAEAYDLESSDRPYQFRPGRLFFPGQRYEPEDLDISKPEVENQYQRTRNTVESSVALKKSDFRNVRFLSAFLSETARIQPRRRNRFSAKAQRKIVREIKTARSLGLMPFTSMGQPPFAFRRPGYGPNAPNGSGPPDFDRT